VEVLAGDYVDADHNNDLEGRKQVGYAHRGTTSTAASAAQGALRISSIPLTFGLRYHIYTNTVVMIPSVNDVRPTLRLSHTVNNTNAGTGSTLMALFNAPVAVSTSDGLSANVGYTYTPAAPGEILSVCLWHQRLAGTGTVHLLGTVGAGIQLHVDCLGPAAADTGTDL
jgi:hypothetical protein